MTCPKCGASEIFTDADVDPDLPHTCTACFYAFSDADVRRNVNDPLSSDNEGEPGLLAGEVLGWRAWYVKDIPGVGLRLQSGYGRFPTVWEPFKVMKAECPNGHTDIPMEGIHCCGFYSALTREHLVDLGYNAYRLGDPFGPIVVIGQIACAGKVIPGTQGWRAAEAWPVRLYVPYDKWQVVKPLRDAYNIPVELDKTLGKGQGY